MLVNRTRRRKKFLELAIWEVFYGRKRSLMNVDKQHVMQQLCSVSVDFQQYFLIKEDLTESFFHLERRRI